MALRIPRAGDDESAAAVAASVGRVGGAARPRRYDLGVVVAGSIPVAVVAEATGLGSGRVRLAAWVVINGLLSIECPGRRGR